ncbi:MAG TPA: translation elongation factor 4 [Candidatus Wallbacteria bacterium]|nr:translation elongation factor 4 [Candidatus Wallbacteria bacterium]
MGTSHIRNFSIIAHIDHGKSTLADRILELTGAVSKREMSDQLLDSMDLEKERGITIKASAVKFEYKARSGETFLMNLIDTPGHVDFTYEVSRALAACEGALLVVDATQGVEAQTVANMYLALENNLEIVPVINKIDLPSAMADHVEEEIVKVLGIDHIKPPKISAKEGKNIDEVLESVVAHVPPPKDNSHLPLRALIFDSFYDSYKGVIAYVRVFDGEIKKGQRIKFMANNKEYEVIETGVLMPKMTEVASLSSGHVGFVAANVKTVSDLRIGDTITSADCPAKEPMAGYKDIKPMVFCGVYPVDNTKYEVLREALTKYKLNDCSVNFEPENSVALGFGFRCGFLGLLHMDVFQERIEREYGLEVITTAPSVKYRVLTKKGEEFYFDNPAKMPDPTEIESTFEPFIKASIFTPKDYVGTIMDLTRERRGTYLSMDYIDDKRVTLHYEMPLAEMVIDFYDKLKSRTKGYASLDYELGEYKESDVVKIDILLNNEAIDALSFITHKDFAHQRSKILCEKLKKSIPRQLFVVPIQGAIGNKIIARETIGALRKDVTAKCYGGDISRKRKLLEKQKEGKKRMKMVGTVEIPQEAFMALLQIGEEE